MKSIPFKLICIVSILLGSPEIKAQFYSVSSNISALATGSINLEASIAINRKISFHLPVSYNPFVYSDNKKIQHIIVNPGVRYWLLESYSNTFVGLNAIATKYNIGLNKHRYQGEAYGLGISGGYAYLLSPRWNIEGEIGLGMVWADYSKYLRKKCGRKIEDYNHLKLIPNKISISIVYLF